MKKITLKHPITINGKQVTELTHDANQISVEQYIEADVLKAKGNSGTYSILETDASFHLYLGFMAIIAVNPSYDVRDLERVKGTDIRQIAVIGRAFAVGKVDNETDSEESNLEKSAEPTVAPSTLQ